MFNSLFRLLSSSVCKCHHTHLDIQNSQWTGLKAMQFHLPWSLPSFMHGEKCLEHCRWHHYTFFFLSAAEMVCKEKSCWPKSYGLQWVSVVAGGIFNLCCGMWESLVAACRIFFFFLSCGMQTPGCGMWDLVPWSEIKPGPPALAAWNLSHWTTRGVPYFTFLNLPWDSVSADKQ